MLQWLTPILEARQENKYYYHDGAPTRAFALLAERRLHVTLLWTYGTKGAIDDLVRQMRGDENLFLRVLELAIENAQEQAEMAVHVALTLVHLFTRSVTRAPYLTSSSGT